MWGREDKAAAEDLLQTGQAHREDGQERTGAGPGGRDRGPHTCRRRGTPGHSSEASRLEGVKLTAPVKLTVPGAQTFGQTSGVSVRVLLSEMNVQAAAGGERTVFPMSPSPREPGPDRHLRRESPECPGGDLPPLGPLRLNPHSCLIYRLQTPGSPPPPSQGAIHQRQCGFVPAGSQPGAQCPRHLTTARAQRRRPQPAAPPPQRASQGNAP